MPPTAKNTIPGFHEKSKPAKSQKRISLANRVCWTTDDKSGTCLPSKLVFVTSPIGGRIPDLDDRLHISLRSLTVYRMDTTIDYQTLCSLVQPLNSCTLASAPTKKTTLPTDINLPAQSWSKRGAEWPQSNSLLIKQLEKQVMTSVSGDSWMYPYQRTPMGNPYIIPIWVHPIVPWLLLFACWKTKLLVWVLKSTNDAFESIKAIQETKKTPIGVRKKTWVLVVEILKFNFTWSLHAFTSPRIV